MKKILLLFFLILTFQGCVKKFDTPVETKQAVYQVAAVATFASFAHTLTDSIINPSIEFTSTADINKVWIEILSPENIKISAGVIYLSDNGSVSSGDAVKGDKIYSALVLMKDQYINGFYSINYFVEDNTGTIKKVAAQTFLFDNGKSNVAPQILSISTPDTIEVINDPVDFIVTASVSDSNGINDIKEVYFSTVRPDQTSSGATTSLYDDGNFSQHGDASAGDGIYSRALSIETTNQKGTYRFGFTAKDRGGLLSPVVYKYIVVK